LTLRNCRCDVPGLNAAGAAAAACGAEKLGCCDALKPPEKLAGVPALAPPKEGDGMVWPPPNDPLNETDGGSWGTEPPKGEDAGVEAPNPAAPNPVELCCPPNDGGCDGRLEPDPPAAPKDGVAVGNPNDVPPFGVALALVFPPNGLGVTLPLLAVEYGLA
jgi:hypothetical protein